MEDPITKMSSRTRALALVLAVVLALAAAGKKAKAAVEPPPETGVTLAALVDCAPRIEVQLVILALQAVFWFVFIKLATKYVVLPIMSAHPKRDQFAHLNQMTFEHGYGIHFDDEQAFFFGCIFIAILAQHGLGGALCLPSVLGFTAPIAGVPIASIACWGALCETGWEVQDGLERIYQLTFEGKEGKAKNPPALCILMCFHHAMGLSMVIPMNLKYRDNRYYHELVFLLEFAAFIAMSLQLCVRRRGSLSPTPFDLVLARRMRAGLGLTHLVYAPRRAVFHWQVRVHARREERVGALQDEGVRRHHVADDGLVARLPVRVRRVLAADDVPRGWRHDDVRGRVRGRRPHEPAQHAHVHGRVDEDQEVPADAPRARGREGAHGRRGDGAHAGPPPPAVTHVRPAQGEAGVVEGARGRQAHALQEVAVSDACTGAVRGGDAGADVLDECAHECARGEIAGVAVERCRPALRKACQWEVGVLGLFGSIRLDLLAHLQ